jgi:hypothetical protein
MYYYAIGLEKGYAGIVDMYQAVIWFQTAAEFGHLQSRNHLSKLSKFDIFNPFS